MTVQLDGPFCALPAELTADIFKLSIWVDIHSIGHEDHERQGYPRGLVTPLTLGAVCRSWRSFVWGTPPLWTVIVMLLSYSRYNIQIDLLKVWLQNSKSYQLDIWFDVNLEFYHSPEGLIPNRNRWGDINLVLRIIVDASRRWRKFSSITYFESINVLSEVQGKVPLLQASHLHWVSDFSAVSARHHMGLLEDAPLLKHLTMTSWSPRRSDITSAATNFHEEESPVGVVINFPCLRTLAIMVSSLARSIAATTLKSIRCSALRRLHVRSFDLQAFQDLDNFIDRSDCPLEFLDLSQTENIAPILPILAKLPSLKYLQVQNMIPRNASSPTSEFFGSLLTKLDLSENPPTIYLPDLEELLCLVTPPSFYSATQTSLRSLKLLKVLRQRRNPPSGVSKLKMVTVGGVLMLDRIRDIDVIIGLRELKREGMNITVPGL